mgnify:CR=1
GSLLAHLLGVGVLLALPPGPRATPTLLEARPVQVWQALPAPSPRWAAPIPEVRPPEPPTGPAARPRVPVPPAACPAKAPLAAGWPGRGRLPGLCGQNAEWSGSGAGRRLARKGGGSPATRIPQVAVAYDSPPPSLPPPPASNPPAPP